MNRASAERIIRDARACGKRPDLCNTFMSGTDLYGADLRGTDLCDADLYRANLAGATLRQADLTRADLRRADLYWANLVGANLVGADLRWANLAGAQGVVALGTTPSREADLRPLPNGTWCITVGCWSGTTDDLRTLIAGDDWPSRCSEQERNRRRPILTALAQQADALADYHRDWLTAVVEKWGAGGVDEAR